MTPRRAFGIASNPSSRIALWPAGWSAALPRMSSWRVCHTVTVTWWALPSNTALGAKHRYTWLLPQPGLWNGSMGPSRVYDETQLRAYYRSIPDMQHPTQVFGRIPIDRWLRPPPAPPSPPCGAPSSAVGMTPDRNAPPVVSHPDDASLLRQYHRISLVVSSRRAVNPTRGGGHTARCILSHGQRALSRDDAVCHDVYKHIARVAHPDKNPVRNAYHCAVAGIVMDTIQRAYDMVVSSSSSDRDAFHLLPALDSAQFEDMVDAHRLAKIGHTPPVRSPVTPVHGARPRRFPPGPFLGRATHSTPPLARLRRFALA